MMGAGEPHGPVALRRLLARSLALSRCRSAMNSSWVAKGPATLPARYSFRLRLTPRMIARRACGVYSLSALGSFGTIVITPPEVFTSSSCPRLNPARRRAAGGTTTGALFLTATVIGVGLTGWTAGDFHFYNSRDRT